ncbi:hypothetical protein AB840_14715 [Megasphaera cerevisiae DSM 20462]|jgi:hypothetical protein|uniref:Uncharacterized protein n=1 Tax=Megasphaera cerevisiae DSM 20462 TaxID=1122219 RepID=A0A0J6WTY2_9FIRM|nr:hypothetical protein AB840_14715 [Megasphaera cerevisiae DSM 20462]SKA25256.1 hypothetical protein SAMN05660900_03031 [Megasphaera cerevisiae DSM 20462]
MNTYIVVFGKCIKQDIEMSQDTLRHFNYSCNIVNSYTWIIQSDLSTNDIYNSFSTTALRTDIFVAKILPEYVAGKLKDSLIIKKLMDELPHPQLESRN